MLVIVLILQKLRKTIVGKTSKNVKSSSGKSILVDPVQYQL